MNTTQLHLHLAHILGWTNVHYSEIDESLLGCPPGLATEYFSELPEFNLDLIHEVELLLGAEAWTTYISTLAFGKDHLPGLQMTLAGAIRAKGADTHYCAAALVHALNIQIDHTK